MYLSTGKVQQIKKFNNYPLDKEIQTLSHGLKSTQSQQSSLSTEKRIPKPTLATRGKL